MKFPISFGPVLGAAMVGLAMILMEPKVSYSTMMIGGLLGYIAIVLERNSPDE